MLKALSETGVRTISLQNIYTGRFVCVRGGDKRLFANHDSQDGDDIDSNGYFIIDGTDDRFTMKSSATERKKDDIAHGVSTGPRP